MGLDYLTLVKRHHVLAGLFLDVLIQVRVLVELIILIFLLNFEFLVKRLLQGVHHGFILDKLVDLVRLCRWPDLFKVHEAVFERSTGPDWLAVDWDDVQAF